jgi:hypothetical protein
MYQHVVLSEAPVMIGHGSSLSADLRFALRLSFADCLYLIPLRVNCEAVGVIALGEEYHSMPDNRITQYLSSDKVRSLMVAEAHVGTAVERALTLAQQIHQL